MPFLDVLPVAIRIYKLAKIIHEFIYFPTKYRNIQFKYKCIFVLELWVNLQKAALDYEWYLSFPFQGFASMLYRILDENQH